MFVGGEMSGKRIFIRFLMLLILWGALFAMFNLTQGLHPFIRILFGLAICGAYVFAQVKINRKMYGDVNYTGGQNTKANSSGNDNKDSKEEN